MFKRLVTNLSFSPSLIGHLSLYSNRLKREEATRRGGLIVTTLAVALQLFIMVSPSQSSSVSSPGDLMPGSLVSQTDLLRSYDDNNQITKSVMSLVGISRQDLTTLKQDRINSVDLGKADTSWHLWTRTPFLSASEGERRAEIDNQTVLYTRPLWRYDTGSWGAKYGTSYSVLRGVSEKAGPFAITQSGGNLITSGSLQVLAPSVNPSESNRTIHCRIDDNSACARGLTLHKTARNLTQNNEDASQTVAQADDRIEYSLKLTNGNTFPVEVTISDYIGDITEYASLYNNGGAMYNRSQSRLEWGVVKIAPGETATRVFAIKINSTIPLTAKSASHPSAYDCRVSNTFGNTVQISIDCPTPKAVERLVSQLPTIDPMTIVAFCTGLVATTSYFYLRNRQLQKELRIIRHDINSGIV